MKTLATIMSALAVAAAMASSAVAQSPAPADVADGQALFGEKCGMCHRTMGMGTVLLARRMDPAMAQLEARGDLTAAYVIAAARSGVGNMPRIQRGEVSDAQLAAIAAYLDKTKARRP